jgi:hypothetical protein
VRRVGCRREEATMVWGRMRLLLPAFLGQVGKGAGVAVRTVIMLFMGSARNLVGRGEGRPVRLGARAVLVSTNHLNLLDFNRNLVIPIDFIRKLRDGFT